MLGVCKSCVGAFDAGSNLDRLFKEAMANS
jgi:hypothetical protein